MIYRAILLGAALAAPIPVLAQSVQTDPQGYSPYNSRQVIVNQGMPGPIREAPALALPSIYGLNPCSLGAAVGATTPLFGASFAISSTDRDCQIRNTAALTVSALDDKEAAREIMCDIKEFREALLRLGKPCIVDRPPAPVAVVTPPIAIAAAVPGPVAPKADAASTPTTGGTTANLPVATAKSVSAAVVMAATSSEPMLSKSVPAYCHVANLQLSLYPECLVRKDN